MNDAFNVQGKNDKIIAKNEWNMHYEVNEHKVDNESQQFLYP